MPEKLITSPTRLYKGVISGNKAFITPIAYGAVPDFEVIIESDDLLIIRTSLSVPVIVQAFLCILFIAAGIAISSLSYLVSGFNYAGPILTTLAIVFFVLRLSTFRTMVIDNVRSIIRIIDGGELKE